MGRQKKGNRKAHMFNMDKDLIMRIREHYDNLSDLMNDLLSDELDKIESGLGNMEKHKVSGKVEVVSVKSGNGREERRKRVTKRLFKEFGVKNLEELRTLSEEKRSEFLDRFRGAMDNGD